VVGADPQLHAERGQGDLVTSPAPYARRARSVPVTVVADAASLPLETPGLAIVRLERAPHSHADGESCVVCESRGTVRATLFELDEKLRRGLVPAFERVVVDASRIDDVQSVIDALVPGRQPVLGLRDHAVFRNFRLTQ
jgi:hypothetical protein